MNQFAGAAEEYLCLVAGVGTAVALGILVATHEVPELDEGGELRLGGLTGREQRELGAQPAQVVDHAVLTDALRAQQLAGACLVLGVHPCLQAEHRRQHEHLKGLQAVVGRPRGAWVLQSALHVSPQAAVGLLPDTLVLIDYIAERLDVGLIRAQQPQELDGSQQLVAVVRFGVFGQVVEVGSQSRLYVRHLLVLLRQPLR